MKQINIINAETTEEGSPITKLVDLSSYTNIKYGQIKTQLHSNDPTIIIDEWRISKIVVNDKVFYPSNPRNSSNKIHDQNDTDFYKNVLVKGKNRISVHWLAPFGAGVISPHSKISAQLNIDGDEFLPVSLPEEINTVNFENIKQTTDTFISNASLPTFAILIIVAIILIFLFLALSRGAVIAQTVNKVI